jgi:hypothetical protein
LTESRHKIAGEAVEIEIRTKDEQRKSKGERHIEQNPNIYK